MSNRSGPLARIITTLTKVEANEIRATVLSFFFIFILMVAYFILRPVRDAMASDWGRAEVSWLWTQTFLFSVVAVSLYGGIISRIRFSHVVPAVYGFFATTFALFWFGTTLVADSTSVDKVFYVWLSVFSLFHVSVFWSFMSGVYSKQQAPRLFAIIGTGASVGAIVGPIVPTFFADDIGTMNLLWIAAALLLVPIPIIASLEKLKKTELGNADLEADLSRAKQLGKNPFSGFMLFVKNPYLLAIGAFILMYVTMNTFIFMELREMLADFDREQRTQIWGGIDLAVNTLTVVTAIFVTGRLATRFGMAPTLALIPVLMVGGWLVVALVPLLAVLIGLQIARRAGNYAITRPGREMLFTLVDSETRYKAKPVVDIVVYRGGDMLTAWIHTGLKETLAFGLPGIAIAGAIVAACWATTGAWLGRQYEQTGSASEETQAPAQA
ncbi:MAG: MFS transporter [Woeseiaceae bacterium]|nr:MFS transporter [Woeseiaceae bacterium]